MGNVCLVSFTDKLHSLSPAPDDRRKLATPSRGESPLVSGHTRSGGHVTRHSSLYRQHILSSTQFSREQLHHLFHVAHEMRMTVSRSGSVDLMKVATSSVGVVSGCGLVFPRASC